MNSRMIHVQSDEHVIRQPFSKKLVRSVRLALRLLGTLIYHLGLAPLVIGMSPNRVRTLLYHAVEDHPVSYTAGLGMSITTEAFRQHLDYYKRHYQIVSMHDLLAGNAGPRAAMLTFDDGYASVGENAVPAMEDRGIPGTVFLIGKAVSGGMVWVNQLNHALNCYPQVTMTLVNSLPGLEHAQRNTVIHLVQTTFSPRRIEQLISRLEASLPLPASQSGLFLDREDIKALKSRGLSFGFHSNDHYNLQTCDEASLRQQLDSSELDDLLDTRTFAYPFGYCGDREANRLAARGFQRAMLVSQDTPHPRKANMKRCEPSGQSAAAVFAQLEVEEPLMEWLRSLLL